MKFIINFIQWCTENLELILTVIVPVGAFFIIVTMVPDITARIRKFKLALREAFTPLGFAVLVLAMLVFYFFYELYRGLL